MAAIGTAFVRIQPDLDGFEKEATKGIGGAAKKAAAAFAGAFAAAQVGSYLKDSIGAASDLNETISKTEVIFGDAGQAVQDFAAGGAKSLGQSKQTVLDAAATFGTFGKAAGLGGQDLAKFSTDFVGLSTDLASFNNTTPRKPSTRSGRPFVARPSRCVSTASCSMTRPCGTRRWRSGSSPRRRKPSPRSRRSLPHRPPSTSRPATHRATSPTRRVAWPTSSGSCRRSSRTPRPP